MIIFLRGITLPYHGHRSFFIGVTQGTFATSKQAYTQGRPGFHESLIQRQKCAEGLLVDWRCQKLCSVRGNDSLIVQSRITLMNTSTS